MTKEMILSEMAKSTTSTTARTRTGTKVHAMSISGQGRTNCGVRGARPVKVETLTKFAHLCDKCFILSEEN